MFRNLPDELVGVIFEFLKTRELCQAALIDHRCYRYAIPLLYHTIRGISGPKMMTLLISLLFHEHTPKLIRTITIEWKDRPLKEQLSTGTYLRCLMKYGTKVISMRRVFHDRISLLNAALRRMTHVTNLGIMVDLREKVEKYTDRILEGCAFTLTSFTTSLTCGPTLMNFLKTQRELHTLNLNTASRLSQIPQHAFKKEDLPHLKTFGWTEGVPSDFIQHIFGTFPIEKANVVLSPHHTSRMLRLLTPEQRDRIKVAFFKYQGTPKLAQLTSMTKELPKLERIKITSNTIMSRVSVY